MVIQPHIPGRYCAEQGQSGRTGFLLLATDHAPLEVWSAVRGYPTRHLHYQMKLLWGAQGETQGAKVLALLSQEIPNWDKVLILFPESLKTLKTAATEKLLDLSDLHSVLTV